MTQNADYEGTSNPPAIVRVYSEFWLQWPDIENPAPGDRPFVTLGRPAGDGHCQRILIPLPPSPTGSSEAVPNDR